VIVVSWNGRELLRRCLASVEKHLANVHHETLVVDNASADGTPDVVEREFPAVRLIRNERNLGFGRGNNIGMTAARGDFFVLLNSDAELIDDTPIRLIERLRARPECGVAGPLLRFPDGRIQASAHRFPSVVRLFLEESYLYKLLPAPRASNILLGGYWHHAVEREVDWITGACMVVRRAVFEETKGFDPAIFLYGEEIEWCHRIRARGWSVLFSPVGEVRHVGHASSELLLGDEGRIHQCLLADDRLLRRWHGLAAMTAAGLTRVAGAALKLLIFSIRVIHRRDERYARDVRDRSRIVLRHYGRRLFARLEECRP
jgi:GT2 family glycosyltransferase